MGLIGDTLAEARTRRQVDLEEVHAATGIRPRHLRAIEEEDWAALPEEFYIRSWIRKYAEFLGVAPEPLVEEYRRRGRRAEGRGGAPTTPFARTTSRRAESLRRRRRRQELYAWIGGAAVLVAIVVAIVVVLSSSGGGAKKHVGGPGDGPAQGPTGQAGGKRAGGAGRAAAHRPAKARLVSLRIEPTAEVWACVENAKGKALVDGQVLADGEDVGPFRSRSFVAAFGNGSVEVRVDGKRVRMPSTSGPTGIKVDRRGKAYELPEGRRPSCE